MNAPFGPHYLTLHPRHDGDIDWDLRSGTPEGSSVRLACGTAFTWAAACHQAGRILQRRVSDLQASTNG